MKIYNTLTKNIQYFETLKDKTVTIYVCGITPYDTTHLGHAFTYISFDALIRFFKYKGYRVDYSQNVTDINDRDNDILKRAKEQNVSWENLSSFWTRKFLNDMNFLNWLKPDHYLFASEQIPMMVVLIEKLLDNKSAYIYDGNVYLDVKKDKDYGKLSGLHEEDMLKIARDFEEDIDNKDKHNPLDITLWRKTEDDQPKHIPAFSSPFGKGRPGWHIECSAMAVSSLGEQIDIHGGGKDLIYPHHEAEIAQSEKATGKIPFAKYWMHTGQVSYKGEKMSKSLGNLVMISDLKEKFSANSIRFMLLSNHYRNDWEYTEKAMNNADKKFKDILQWIRSGKTRRFDPTYKLLALLEEDLDTPSVLKEIYENIGKSDPVKTREFLKVLGFDL